MMTETAEHSFPKEVDTAAIEARAAALWSAERVYEFDPDHLGAIFSVDTPPPYVSAAHLHVGHAMSYSQAEFIVRYQRMKGRSVFYPMGFDDNGLPTERYVEKVHQVDKKKISRSDFRALCLEETKKGAEHYEHLWRGLGLSVDWRLSYSTIDEHCRRTAQVSFLDLLSKERVYRAEEPVLWDTTMETALAQADLETLTRSGKLHDIEFQDSRSGESLVIATTRPELLPACVALYCNPKDERHADRIGGQARVPLFNVEVPILADDDVDPDFGTGLMMVCTFGDGEDVVRWKRDRLELRVCLSESGHMTELAGAYAGLTVPQARKKIVQDLQSAGVLKDSRSVKQAVSVSERSQTPVEFRMVPQWFIRVLDLKDQWLMRSGELDWHPDWMKVRLDQWIEGLRFDWNISRQRFYGVPFPVWYCDACQTPVLAPKSALPVDPLETPCPASACSACGGTDFTPEADVMDTWMTSSLTPLINSNWVGSKNRTTAHDLHPMTLRVQAFEIIRTWLFYTLVKSDRHEGTLPWKQVMISGWGLNEQGKKISKRDLDRFTDEQGYNRYDPGSVIGKYGADALRYWAAGSHLGHDMRYNEKGVRAGRKLVVKLWNAARFIHPYLEGFDVDAPRPPVGQRWIEDRWVIAMAHECAVSASASFENFNYAGAREAIDRFFWQVFTDNYLEMVKERLRASSDSYTEEDRVAALSTLWEVFRIILGLWAPFVPFITEDLYQRMYRESENTVSLHVTAWPEGIDAAPANVPDMPFILEVLGATRTLRTKHRLSRSRRLDSVRVHVHEAKAPPPTAPDEVLASLRAILLSREVTFDETPKAGEPLVAIEPSPEET